MNGNRSLDTGKTFSTTPGGSEEYRAEMAAAESRGWSRISRPSRAHGACSSRRAPLIPALSPPRGPQSRFPARCEWGAASPSHRSSIGRLLQLPRPGTVTAVPRPRVGASLLASREGFLPPSSLFLCGPSAVRTLQGVVLAKLFVLSRDSRVSLPLSRRCQRL